MSSNPPRSTNLALTFAEVRLEGYLTEETLTQQLRQLGLRVPPPRAMLVDASRMTGYDMEARSLFVSWMRERFHDIQRVAIVTDKIIWRMVIHAMSLASSVKMEAFATRTEAMDWLAA